MLDNVHSARSARPVRSMASRVHLVHELAAACSLGLALTRLSPRFVCFTPAMSYIRPRAPRLVAP